jgi:hypothetical protein
MRFAFAITPRSASKVISRPDRHPAEGQRAVPIERGMTVTGTAGPGRGLCSQVPPSPTLVTYGALRRRCGDQPDFNQLSRRACAVAEPRRPEAKSILNELRKHYAALRGYACGKVMSYVEFSRTSSNIVRVRSCRLAVSRRRCRACDGFRGGIRSLEGQGHAKRPPVSASGLVDPTLGYPAQSPASWRRRSEL